MGATLLTKLALVVLVPSLSCLTLCTFRVQPVHGWMMRHACPVAELADHPPSRPIGVSGSGLDSRAVVDPK